MLQKYRGDFGGTPFDIANLTAEEQTQLAAIPYADPTTISSTEVSNEIDRLDDRVRQALLSGELAEIEGRQAAPVESKSELISLQGAQ